MGSNIRIGRLFGIPFYLHPSWFFILALVSWTYGSGLAAQFPTLPAGVPLLLGFGTALLLFASVLAHELGHSLVALRQGIGVQSITLFLFGGLASLEKESETPADAFWVAIAGPLVSLVLFGLFTLVGGLAPAAGVLTAILGVLAAINLGLALFNLIPGLPLDGGNILKAAIWKLTGNPYRGVVVASRVGQVLGWGAIASGLIPLLFAGSFSQSWNLLMGWFLLQNARRVAQVAMVQERFTGLTAADAVTHNSPVVDATLSLREFADQRILNADGWRKFLVVDAEGKLLGEVAVDALRAVPSDRWSEVQITAVMQPITQTQTISSEQPLWDAVKLLEERRLSALTVIQDNGILVGLLEKAAVLKLLQHRPQTSPA